MKTITYNGHLLYLAREVGNIERQHVRAIFTDGEALTVTFEFFGLLYGQPEPELTVSEITLFPGDIRALSAFYAREAAKEATS